MSLMVHIEKLVYGGRSLGRHNGRTVLTPFVLPGEKVLVEVERESADLLMGRPLAIESAAEWRAAPPCPYFSRCGGCHYQHIPYQRQLEFKREILLETLARLGKIEWSGPAPIVSGPEWGYRNRVQLRVERVEGRVEIGFLEMGSRRLCPVDVCAISSPAIQRSLAALRRMAGERRFPGFLGQLELFSNESDVQLTVLESARPLARRFFDWCAEQIAGFCRGDSLEYAEGGEVYRVSRRSFFQVNRFLVPRLIELATAGPVGDTAVDLYAGVGPFSLALARRFARVVAVEANLSAARNLEENAGRAGVTVEVRHQPAEEFLNSFDGPADFVLADPPRTGLGPAVTTRLARLKPRRLTVASCDPATLARDLRALVAAGFRIDSVKLIDLFPQTFHIESMVELIGP